MSFQSGSQNPLNIWIAFAPPKSGIATQFPVELPPGSTVADALKAVSDRLPADSEKTWAIYGTQVSPDTRLHAWDRLECLCPLARDPKEARRRRVNKTMAQAHTKKSD